jgi:hypothetical protein
MKLLLLAVLLAVPQAPPPAPAPAPDKTAPTQQGTQTPDNSVTRENESDQRNQRRQRGSVELARSSNECIGDFESTEEPLCCPDFRVTTWVLCIEPPFAKLIRRSSFAKVVVMSEHSTGGEDGYSSN